MCSGVNGPGSPMDCGRPISPPGLEAGLPNCGRSYRRAMRRLPPRWVETPIISASSARPTSSSSFPLIFLSLTRWRRPIAEDGVEGPLTRTIQAGRKSGAIDAGGLKPAAVDRTVIEMNIVHPTDARLFERGGANRAGLAQEAGIKLRPIPRSPGGKTLCEALRERPSRHETVSRQIARIPPWQ